MWLFSCTLGRCFERAFLDPQLTIQHLPIIIIILFYKVTNYVFNVEDFSSS